MERGQVAQGFEALSDPCIDKNGPREVSAAVHDPMPNCVDGARVVDESSDGGGFDVSAFARERGRPEFEFFIEHRQFETR